MTRRRLGAGFGAALLGAGFLAWLFPTDVVVRRVLARAAATGVPAVVFTRAALRPYGIHLEDVTLRAPTGAPLARAEHVRLRPSVWGLVRDRSGLPWTILADPCGGRAEATVAADGPATTVSITWRDADLAACPPLEIAGGALAGRARGAARLRLAPGASPTGAGNVDLDAGTWQAPGSLGSLGPLHAQSASVRWTLRDGRLVLDALDLRGPEVSATGSGEVDLTDPFEESGLTLSVAFTPAPDARGPLGLLFRLSGDPTTTRRLTVGGTLARPSALLQ